MTTSTEQNKETLNVLGHQTEMILTADDTGGNLSMARMEIPPGWGNPVHIHWFEDEAFYVISGLIDITVDDKTTRLGPGQAAFGPRRIAHGFKNPTDQPTTLLVITNPGGIERFFRACDAAFPSGQPIDPAKVADVIERHAMTAIH